MKTPIYDFIKQYADSDAVRLHMPGHKGKGVGLGFEKYDITEISGTEGIVGESEQSLTELFGTASSHYSCEGSSLCVRAMLYLARLVSGQQRGYILAARNAHSSLISASALLDFDIEWLISSSDESYLSCNISAELLEKRLTQCEKKPFCVYITSPDYLGQMADICALSKVCERHGTLLVVDNAHGAYLRFLKRDLHPITLGAHMCCDSAHKTLPALTGGAYLHISKKAPKELSEHARQALSLFATTSPSFLILASLDKTNEYLSNGYSERLEQFVKMLDDMKSRLSRNGIPLYDTEPLKLVIRAHEMGYTGKELATELEKRGFMYEMCDPEVLVFMLTPENTGEELDALEKALLEIPKKPKIPVPAFDFSLPERKTTIRQAIMSPKELVSLDNAVGRVSAGINTLCPPAVSLVVAGEELDATSASLLKRYGFESIYVIK